MQPQKLLQPKDSQLVFVTDEHGIFEAFEHIKSQLSQLTVRFITLIYALNESNCNFFPFSNELNILEKRYSEKFNVQKLHSDSITNSSNALIQEFVEAMINSSIDPKLEFSIFGHVEFVNQIADILNFLNVNTQKKYINK